MSNPIGVMTATTATGDVVTGPGCSTVLCKGMPASCVGDMVSGAACVGSVVAPGKATLLLKSIPVAAVTSSVTGTNPATGVPVTTTVLAPLDPTLII